jgi:hypothetical protein
MVVAVDDVLVVMVVMVVIGRVTMITIVKRLHVRPKRLLERFPN